MMEIKAAWSHDIYKAREATPCIQRKSDQESKGVLHLKLTVTCLQVSQTQSRHLCDLYTSDQAWKW